MNYNISRILLEKSKKNLCELEKAYKRRMEIIMSKEEDIRCLTANKIPRVTSETLNELDKIEIELLKDIDNRLTEKKDEIARATNEILKEMSNSIDGDEQEAFNVTVERRERRIECITEASNNRLIAIDELYDLINSYLMDYHYSKEEPVKIRTEEEYNEYTKKKQHIIDIARSVYDKTLLEIDDTVNETFKLIDKRRDSVQQILLDIPRDGLIVDTEKKQLIEEIDREYTLLNEQINKKCKDKAYWIRKHGVKLVNLEHTYMENPGKVKGRRSHKTQSNRLLEELNNDLEGTDKKYNTRITELLSLSSLRQDEIKRVINELKEFKELTLANND